jgi:hypothetical protein
MIDQYDPIPFQQIPIEYVMQTVKRFPERVFLFMARAIGEHKGLTVNCATLGRDLGRAILHIGDEADSNGIRLGACFCAIMPDGMTLEEARAAILKCHPEASASLSAALEFLRNPERN